MVTSGYKIMYLKIVQGTRYKCTIQKVLNQLSDRPTQPFNKDLTLGVN